MSPEQPFDPKPTILPPEVIEIYQHILDRETPDYLKHRPELVAETKRRAAMLLAAHATAVEQVGPELSEALVTVFGDIEAAQ